MCLLEQWQLHWSSQWGWWTLLNEHVYCVAITFEITEKVEHWICIKCCVKLEHSPTETIWTFQKAFRDDAMSAAQIKVWHKHFKDDWESVESDWHSGRPETSRTPENVEHVWAAINKDLQPRSLSPPMLGTALPGFRGCNPPWLRLSQSWDHKPLRRQSLSAWQVCHLCPLHPAWPWAWPVSQWGVRILKGGST